MSVLLTQGKYTSRAEKNERSVLADVIPIDTPYVFGFFLGDICNFRCKYCVQSVLQGADGTAHEHKGVEDLVRHFMSWETFLRTAEQLRGFPRKIKKILFSSIGEPLLHPRLPQMIAWLKDRDVADDYEVVTNASLLTPDLSKALIDAGLTRLCVSVQGMTAEKYKSVCDYKVDMSVFISNLKSFYDYSRGKCRLHIKTVDIALDKGEDEAFLSTFGDICDSIHIDNVIPLYRDVDYDFLSGEEKGLYKEQSKPIAVCSPLFYTLYVNADGDVIPCCIVPYALSYGNVHQTDIVSMWNGAKRRAFLELHLKKKRRAHPICRDCVHPNAAILPSDVLDDAAEEILARVRAR